MEERTEKIQIYSYAKVWKFEHCIYSIGNIVLPAPIHPNNALYFVGALLFMMLLGKIFPLINLLPVVLRFILIPYGMTFYLRKKKLDGKNPIKYLARLIKYEIFEGGRYFERFKAHSEYTRVEKLNWNCSVRYHKH